MSVLNALGQVIAHAPLPHLLVGVALLLLAWLLRRKLAGPGQRWRAMTARITCVAVAMVLLGIAVRRGAINAARASRSDELRAAIERGEAAGRARYQQDLTAWTACETAGHDGAGCARIAASLLVNVLCQDDCIARLQRRPDVMAVAEALAAGESPPSDDFDAGAGPDGGGL
jgi:hypothetical protein